MTFRYTVSGNSLGELLEAFDELVADARNVGGEVEADKEGSAPAPAPKAAPTPEAAPARRGRGRPPKNPAPDPAPVGNANDDPFGNENGAAPDAPGDDDPFNAPKAETKPPVNPEAIKLIDVIREKAADTAVGPTRMHSYIVRNFGLSPSVTLDEVYDLLRAGKIPAESVHSMLEAAKPRS